jgi:CheY-like chemotaxis protein
LNPFPTLSDPAALARLLLYASLFGDAMEHDASVQGAGSVPPIVLFVDDDPDTLELYSGYFESQGLWTVTATDPSEALAVVSELKPNLVVADIGFGDQPRGLELISHLRADDRLPYTPIMVLSGRPKDELRQSRSNGADLVLAKPCPPQTLLERGRHLLNVSRELRERSRATTERGRQQRERSDDLMAQAKESASRVVPIRRCPSCQGMLEWVERATLEGQEYDYFHWCRNGCGLYCYKPRSQDWIKLA